MILQFHENVDIEQLQIVKVFNKIGHDFRDLIIFYFFQRKMFHKKLKKKPKFH